MDAKDIIDKELSKIKLINRARTYTFNPMNGCYNCGNKTFRYYCKSRGKKYYQCEKCKCLNN